MTVDIFGPAALNAVLTRPADARSFGTAGDTYFKDCSTPSSQDGAQLVAGWLNQVTGTLRTLARVNGMKLDGVTPVVTYDQGDDMVLRALEQMLQRGFAIYGADSGAASAPVLNLAAAPAELVDGLRVRVCMKAAPTGPGILTVNGLAAPILRRNAQALVGGEWAADDVLDFQYVAALNAWQISGLVFSDISAALGTLHTLQNMQQFKTSTRVSMSAAGANTKVTFWSPGNYTKKSPTSNLLIQAFTVGYAPVQTVSGSQNIVGYTIENINIGATVVPFAAANGYASSTASTTQGQATNNSPLALVSGIPAGTYPITLDASRSDANQWTTIFNPGPGDLQGLPPSTTSVLIISEIEP